jgi:glycosyltransferase involved in cell wall biosynthesis
VLIKAQKDDRMNANPTGRIRVLQLITRLIVGGAQETVLYTASCLDKRLFEVEVLSGPQTGSEGSLIQEMRSLEIPLSILPELRREISPVRDLLALVKMVRFMRENHYSIVHTHSSKAGILGRLAAKLAGVPVVIHTVHGWSFHEYMPHWQRWFYIRMERLIASMTDTFILVAESDRQKGIQEGIGTPDQYHLIRSAIPIEEFDPEKYNREAVRKALGIASDAPVLGFIGRFSPQKNPLAWVRIAAIVANRLPACRFLLVGGGPLRPQVESAVSRLGLAERTVFGGLRRDIPSMLAGMDVLLMTSAWEGLPRVIPQALCERVPVVASRVDGIAEAILDGETGFLRQLDDESGLAEACLSLLENNELRKTMGQRGREFASSHFNLRDMVLRLQELYLALLDWSCASN